jgi:hypothetical protein
VIRAVAAVRADAAERESTSTMPASVAPAAVS